MKTNNKAEVGIASAIIMIGIVLSGGITGSVLISLTDETSSTSYDVTNETVNNIVNGFQIVDGYINSSSTDIDEIHLIVRLSPGSDDIALNQTVVIYTTSVSVQYFGENYSTLKYSKLISNQNNNYILATGELVDIIIPVYLTTESVVKLIPSSGFETFINLEVDTTYDGIYMFG